MDLTHNVISPPCVAAAAAEAAGPWVHEQGPRPTQCVTFSFEFSAARRARWGLLLFPKFMNAFGNVFRLVHQCPN
jgi:hypothetical protein